MSGVVFLLPALALTARASVGAIELLVLLAALYCAKPLWRERHALFGPARLIGIAFAVNLAAAAFSLAWSGFEPSFLENPSKQLLAVAAIGLIAAARPRADWFWHGVFAGAAGAAIFAAYQRFGLGMPRAEGFHMPIMFGDIALVLGLMALASIERFVGTRLAMLPYLAFLAGAAASVLSGSRGGWIALLFSFVPLYSYGRPAMKRRIAVLVAVSAVLFAAGYFIPETNIRQRVAEAANDISLYRESGHANSPVGSRFEMWQAAWTMFSEHPLLGVGRANFHEALNQLIARGETSPAVGIYHHAHNEMLNALATQGLLGGFALLFIYAAPLAFFIRCLRRDDTAKPFALAGLLLVLSFIDFGLSQVLFAHHLGTAFYALSVCFLAGLCVMLEQGQAEAARRPSLFQRWIRDVVEPPFAQDAAVDHGPIAGKSNLSLLWRKLRPALALRRYGQARLRRASIDRAAKRILWIYKGAPQVGDSLMDLSSRVLLRDSGILQAGAEFDLYTDPHLHRLYEADDVFARVFSDPAEIGQRSYDLVILDSYKWRCLEAKIEYCRHVPFVTMRGYFSGPEFNRTLFSFYRMQQLLGLDIAEGATRRTALPHMAGAPEDRALAARLAIPQGAVAFAIGGACEERTYRHWERVIRAVARDGRLPAVVLLGSGNAVAMRDAIMETAAGGGTNIVDCVDRYSLAQTFEIMKRCRLVVSADGGLLHVAHAAGLPTVALFDRLIHPGLRLTAANRTVAVQSAGVISDIPEAEVTAAVEEALRLYAEREAEVGK
ncbi:MAG TPA: O-antigen ligase family protein [Paucimonas sp.]|nr:O-antigen ligase family protein [Paucimonas sp.]